MFVTYSIIVMIAVFVGWLLLKVSQSQKLPIIMTVAVVAISVCVYFYIGNVDYADQPYARLQKQEKELQKLSIDELIAQYEAGLTHKDSPQARIVLANMLVRLGKLSQAEKHFAAAYKIDNGKTSHIGLSYAEILIALNDGIITKKVKQIIDKIQKTDTHNPQGLFYQGLWLAQNNQIKRAVTVWKTLVKDAIGKPYEGVVQQNLQSVIAHYKITPDMIGLRINQEITKDNLAMIEQMVASLQEKVKQNPDDKALKARLDDVLIKFEAIKKAVTQN